MADARDELFYPPARVSLRERWASVVVSGLMVGLSVAFSVSLLLYYGLSVWAHHFVRPEGWFYGAVSAASAIGALFGAHLGWFDPPWGGVTFDARERGYIRRKPS